MCRHLIWLLSTLNSAHKPTIYLWLKNENTLQTSRNDITTVLTRTENQRIKCFIPHKLGKSLGGIDWPCIFFWVCSFLPSTGKIKGYPLEHVFPINKIIFCKCAADQTAHWSSLGSTGLSATPRKSGVQELGEMSLKKTPPLWVVTVPSWGRRPEN